MTLRTEDLPRLESFLAIVARAAGLTVDEETISRLTPLVGNTLADWESLTRATAPGLEPMGGGRWTETARARQ